jgi:outer membrane receptor protein involved in Fe transport
MVSSAMLSAQPYSNYEIKTGSISGRVLDAELNQPLPYVNVIIKDASDKIIKGAITNAEGTFKIDKISEGLVTVEITYIGYKTNKQNINIGKTGYDIDVGDIFLEEDAEHLDEVTVVGETSTIQQKIDRKVINIGKDLMTTGPTASEIMNNIPSVNVNQQTGDIALRGNQNVQIMVDGKLSNIPAAQLLRQIPSTSIKQIELITNPSAKYNPEGMSGIINIILIKNANVGFNGNLNVGLGYELEPKFNSSIDMNYRNGKLNFFSSYGNNFSDYITKIDLEQTETGIFQNLKIADQRKTHLLKFGIDYYINDKNTLSVFTNQNLFNGGGLGETILRSTSNTGDNQFQLLNITNENYSEQYNTNYKYDFNEEGHNIELEVDYNRFNNDIATTNSFSGMASRPNFDEFTTIYRNRTTINLDYVNPLSENSKLELGLQALLFESDNDYNSNGRVSDGTGNYIPTSTNFNYNRDIYSAYANYGEKLDKWSYQIGIRAETVYEDALAIEANLMDATSLNYPFENDYIKVYPSAFIAYSPSEKNTYQFSYSKRVDRPGVGQVNPIPEFNTPLISQFGNPELQPQFTNSLEVNYTRNLEKGSITGSIFYRLVQDEINQGVFIDRSDLESGRVILTSDNFGNTTAYGIELSSNYKPTEWWSFNASFDLYARKQIGNAESLDPTIANPTEDDIILNEVEMDNIVYNFRVFNNIKLSNQLSASVFAMYSGENIGLNFEIEPIYFVNLGLRYNILEDNRATFNLNFNNVFNTQEINITSERPFKQAAMVTREFTTVFAGLSYRFGGGKYKAKSRKRRDNNEKQGSGFM